MKCAQFFASLAIVACTIVPAGAAGPGGQWTCEVAGSFAGQLTLDRASYAFTKSAGQAELGSYTSHPAILAHNPAYAPGPAIEVDASYLSITSGPLDELGIDLGFYNASVTPASLVFAYGPGKGMHCTPA